MDKNYLFMNVSILYRCAQKYFDKQLVPYKLGAGQLQFLIHIYENEGTTMQALASKGFYDKGTITKSIQKLEDLGYVNIRTSPQDKRARCLYTTDRAKDIISDIYLIRRQWWERVTKDLNIEETDILESLLERVAQSAGQYLEAEDKEIKFFGLQKLTLLDYPGKMACTVFTGGCNFRCPYCHNSDLVFLPENMVEIKEEDILAFLNKRKGVLEGICISGGEPLLHEELETFLYKVKEMGYLIKLDTNGSYPERLRYLVELGLIDYVAMDIKNTPKDYAKTIGMKKVDIDLIQESVQYLLEDHVDYEFRTTLVKEYHTLNHMKQIGEWLKGAKRYYLQNYVDSEKVIKPGLHGFTKEELEVFKEALENNIKQVELRGI